MGSAAPEADGGELSSGLKSVDEVGRDGVQ